jgi:glycosyltransferase involved in cell wall biosynthesis
VIVSDSRNRDEPRTFWKEACKRLLLRGYSSALVAGSESRAYLEGLGFPAAAIFQPWDVVDNAFFRDQAVGFSLNQRLQPHFLCISRFVAKKNHLLLLDAYDRYQRDGGKWGLRLIGCGPLALAIRAAVANLPYPDRVQLEPFQQLDEVGHAYAAASGFVLASHSDQWGLVVNEAMAAGLPVIVSRGCGCAVDLIEDGVTGWSFAPADSDDLSTCLHAVEALPQATRAQVAAASWERLQHFTPESFASSLRNAVEWALQRPRQSHRSTMMASLLSRRT